MSKYKNCASVPAGMEADSDDDFFFDEDAELNQYVACASSTSNNNNKTHAKIDAQRSDQHDNRNNSASSSKQNGCNPVKDPVPFAASSATDDNENHWRQYRMHVGLPVPVDEFRMAIIRGNLGIIQSLVNQGFEVDTMLKSGWTGLMFACSCGEPEITRYLLEHKADPNFHKERFTPLMAACASSNEQEDRLLTCVQSVIEFGGDVSSYERHHVTALMFAAREGRAKIVKTLLDKNVDMDAIDNRGWTALAWAISGGHMTVVRLLLEANAVLKDIKGSGQTLIEFAYYQEQKIIANLLESFANDRKLPEIVEVKKPESVPLATEAPFVVKKCNAIHYGDLEMFLAGLNLSQLIPVFHMHELSFAQVLRFCDEDLQKLGITKMGARRKILDGIREVHRKEWQESSLPNKERVISCPDAVCMVANIGKHLSYIESTVCYLRDQIQAQPRILELGQEINSVQTLLHRIEDALKNNRHLHDELRFLKLHLNKIQDNVEYVPGDLIVERSSPNGNERGVRRGSFAFTTTVVLLGIALVGTAIKRPHIFGHLLTWKLG